MTPRPPLIQKHWAVDAASECSPFALAVRIMARTGHRHGARDEFPNRCDYAMAWGALGVLLEAVRKPR